MPVRESRRTASGGEGRAEQQPGAILRETRTDRRRRRRKHRARTVASVALTVALTVALIAAWTVTLRPTTLGGPASYAIVAGDSMRPTLSHGDLVISRPQSSYDVGDIVLFQIPAGQLGEGMLVLHRIIAEHPDGTYELRGDSRRFRDTWRPSDDNIVGGRWITVPGVGRHIIAARDPTVVAAAAAAITLLVLLWPAPTRRHDVPSSSRRSSSRHTRGTR